MREAPLSTPGPTPGRPAAALLSPCHTPLRRCGISGAPQRVATPAARSERPERPGGFRPPLRPEPFTLMSPRTDATQHMAHQRAAAEAARLQRQPRPPQGAAEAHHAEGHIIAGDRMPRQESGQGGGRTLRAAPPPARCADTAAGRRVEGRPHYSAAAASRVPVYVLCINPVF